MALVPIVSQSWDTTSVFTPTRMNNIEQNLAIVSDATGVKYSNGVSVKDKIDEVNTYSREVLGSVLIQRRGYIRTVSATYGLVSGITSQTLSQSDRPKGDLYITCDIISNNQSTWIGTGVVKINESGTIEIKLNNSATSDSNRCAFALTYFVY